MQFGQDRSRNGVLSYPLPNPLSQFCDALINDRGSQRQRILLYADFRRLRVHGEQEVFLVLMFEGNILEFTFRLKSLGETPH